MLKKIIAYALLHFFILVPVVQAKVWDERLLKASEYAYAANTDAAIKLIDSYITDFPEDPNAYLVKVNILEWKASLEGSLHDRKALVALLESAQQLAWLRYDQHQADINAQIDLGNSYLFLGRHYSEMGYWMKAVLTAKKGPKYLSAAYGQDPMRLDALFALGSFHYLADQMPTGAKPFRAILGIKGDRVLGLQEIKQSTKGIHPWLFDARLTLYKIYEEYEADYSSAQVVLDGLLKQFPKNPEFYFQAARLQERQNGPAARKQYQQLLDFCKKNNCAKYYYFLAHYNIGRLSKDVGEDPLALTSFTAALKYPEANLLYPTQWIESYYWPGLIYLKNHDTLAALKAFRLALAQKTIAKGLKREIEKAVSDLCSQPAMIVACEAK